MAEYKKKTVKKLKTPKPKKSVVADGYKVTPFREEPFSQEIEMKTAKTAKAERRFEKKKEKYLNLKPPQKRVVNSNKSASELNRTAPLKVIKGTKKAKRIKAIIALACAFAIVLSLVLVNANSPTGLIDLIRCSFTKMGSGSGFPITVNGGTVSGFGLTDGCITVVTDTYIEMYNPSSKELVSEQHKYSVPKVSSSVTRTVIYDQGHSELSVYDVSGKLYERDMKEEILTASIGRNGTYAVITDPSDNAAGLYVYNKENKPLFNWSTKSDLINSVAVTDSGKYIAVSTLNAKNGEYYSSLKIFETKSGKIIKDESLQKLINSITAIGKNGFVISSNGELLKLNAEEGSLTSVTDSTVLQKYTNTNGELCLITAFGSKNKLNLYNSEYEKTSEFNIISSPKFVRWNGKYVVCFKDYVLYVYDMKGNEVNKINTGSPIDNAVVTDKGIVVINSSSMLSYDFVSEDKK